MRIFQQLYQWTLKKAAHPHAPFYLATVSFMESSFFPVPPDTLLLPMTITQPKNAWRDAWICSLASVAGGIFGYLLGFFFGSVLEPWLLEHGYGESMVRVKELFQYYGVWIVFIAGFSPIPYKLFTVVSGMLGLNFFSFVVASFCGRTPRFFIVAAAGRLLGERAQDWLKRYVDRLAWLTLIAIALGLILYWRLH